MKKFLSLIAVFGIFLGILTISPLSSQARTDNTPKIFIQYAANPSTCRQTTNDQVNNYSLVGWKLQSGLTDFKINYSTGPQNFSRTQLQSIIEGAFANIQSVNNGIIFRYAGNSSTRVARNDRQNTIMWRPLPSNMVAVTYIWTDSNGRLADADTIFNNQYRWAYTIYNGSNDCSGPKTSFDLRNIAIHEFTHWMGIGDLYDANSRDLTMYGFAGKGELKKGSLGLGDVNAIRSVWP